MAKASQKPFGRLRVGVVVSLFLPLAACGVDTTVAQSPGSTTGQMSQSPVDRKHTGFSLIDDYVLKVGDDISGGASLYASGETRALLIMSDDLPAPVLLWPRSRRVETLQMLKIARKPGGEVEILPDPVIGVHPAFKVVTPDVKFSVDGIEAALTPKPPLVGLQGLENMLGYSQAYQARAEAYVPS